MIKKIINEWDPIEFFPMAPEDEYSNEILKIEKYLADNGNIDVQTLAVAIDNIFASSFGRDVYLADMNDCVEVAKKILNTSLFTELEKGEALSEKEGWISIEDAEKSLGL